MAAGLGFKDFVTGEVLTAADVDGYLMQGIWVFASAAARDAAVTSPQEGNACYLKDTNEVLTYSGSAWVAVGGAGGGMTLLSTLNLAGVSSATTSAFSSAYKQIFIYLTGLYAATASETWLRLNGDSGATKYTANFILGSGGSVSTGATGGDSKYYVADLTTDSTAKYQNSAFITIMKPSNTGKFFISSSAVTYVAGVKNFQGVGTYDGSAAITSVTIASGVNFTAGTAEIYGVN